MTPHSSGPAGGAGTAPVRNWGAEFVVAAAVDNVEAGEVADRCGEDVDESAERPEREQDPGGEHVQSESDGGAQDQVRVGLEVEDRSEPWETDCG